MLFTLTMPKLSPTMESGSVVKWHKQVGDRVEAGDLLLEVSTDKATVEHNALDEGWLRKIIVPEGKEAVVNEPIALFSEEQNESIEGFQETLEKKSEAKSVDEKSDEKSVEKSPDQAAAKTASSESAVPLVDSTSQNKGRILASPLAKKLAQQKSLDLSSIQGSGPGGRIMKKDLENAPTVGKKAFTPTGPSGGYVEEALTPIRKIIAQRLQEAKATIPHFYVQQAIDASFLISLREQLKNRKINLTYNDFVLKACALALKQHPVVNSGFNAKNQTIMRFSTVDISVAVSISAGLITPIVCYADQKNILEISTEVKSLSKKAKEGKLEPREYQGGSFTISNLGMYGVTDFQAIINPPQAAILAISGIADVPVVKENQIVPGKVMNLTLSVDHRVIDGVAAAEFLKTLQSYLENPAFLLL